MKLKQCKDSNYLTNGDNASHSKILFKMPTKGDNNDSSSKGNSNFRNKVKLLQTTTMPSRAFGEGGIKRFANKKSRIESNLGINVNVDNLNCLTMLESCNCWVCEKKYRF